MMGAALRSWRCDVKLTGANVFGNLKMSGY